MRAAELEGQLAEYGGYDAEARAGSILPRRRIPEGLHNGPMREVAPGLKLRVLLAQALFSEPTCCCWMSPPTTWTSTPSVGSKR